MRKNILFLYLIPCIFLLSGCKEEDFTTENLAKITNKIMTYDYKGKWQSFKNYLKIANKTRYSENQYILIETPRDTQTTTYQNIISECKNIGCNIIGNTLHKNMVFPEHIAGTIEFYIPSNSAQTFINNIAKYGNITINDYTSDSRISEDIEVLTKQLEILQNEQKQSNELLTGPNLQNVTQISLLQDRINKLNENITALQSDIKHLESQIGNRHIFIRIRRGFNSTAGFAKGQLHDAFLIILDYLHIIIIIALVFCIKYMVMLIKHIHSSIKISLAKRTNKKQKEEANKEFKEPKFTPQL